LTESDPVGVVREQFAATNARDFERAMTFYADDVTLVIEDGFLNTGTFEGREAVGEWFGDWFRAFGDDYHFEFDEIREVRPGLVFSTASHVGTGRASGAEVHNKQSYLHRVRDGRIGRLQLFISGEDALEAASLPEWSDPQTG
jgi:ketosteroid isomerase-like protein